MIGPIRAFFGSTLTGSSMRPYGAPGELRFFPGESAGEVVATTAAVYAEPVWILFGILVFGRVAKQLPTHVIGALPRMFSWKQTPSVPPAPSSLHPLWRPMGFMGADSDSGASSRSNIPTRSMGRLTRQAHSVWLFGISAHVLTPPPCTGRGLNPPH